jgi:TctA family transporter
MDPHKGLGRFGRWIVNIADGQTAGQRWVNDHSTYRTHKTLLTVWDAANRNGSLVTCPLGRIPALGATIFLYASFFHAKF